VVDPLVPGDRVNTELPKDELQPLRTVLERLKLELPQDELSLLVTVAVKLTVVPETTQALCAGDRLNEGLAWVQLEVPTVTCTVAPVLSPETGVIVTPAVESEKLCPTVRAGSRNDPLGVMSSRSLLLELPGAAW